LQAGNPAHTAVQLKYLVIGNTGSLVQAVHILGNHAVELIQSVKFGNGVMGWVWLHRLRQALFPEQLPLLLSCAGITDEFLVGEIVGIKAIPDTARAAEIGYARFRTYAGASEDNDFLRPDNQVGHTVGQMEQSMVIYRFVPIE
jgi:hypothetical protein